MDAILIFSIIFPTVRCLGELSPSFVVNLTSSNLLTLHPRQILPIVREEKLKFILYTRKYPNGYRLFRNNYKNLLNSGFKSTNPTKVIIHGYSNNYTSPAIKLPKNAYLSNGKYNVLAVDWSEYSYPYVFATTNTKYVGHLVGLMVSYLTDAGDLRLSDVHFIGYSLGAHVAGYAVEKLRSKPARITGLDPAGPLFSDNPPSQRLGEEDAEFVDVIHTSVKVLGIYQNIGHADFYPAGGKRQPGCSTDIVEDVIGACDHGKSYVYFTKSILLKNLFPAVKCRSLSDAIDGKCKGSNTTFMGESAINSKPRGIYYVDVPRLEQSLKIPDRFPIYRRSRRIFDLKIF